ncbi:uncharacterized protein V1510DRAFT_353102, partial [Dipodascopsis tothii]|uniref:uncharacterized protein n=1 Tax=Dipodascopsis tothii TaxID=44089 RepID=UPI0034CDBA1A
LPRTVETLLDSLLPAIPHSPAPPAELLSPHVQLRLLPKTHPRFPAVRGRVAYMATWRLAQMVLPFVALGPVEGAAAAVPDERRLQRDQRVEFVVDSLRMEDASGATMALSSGGVRDVRASAGARLYVRWRTLFTAPADGPDGRVEVDVATIAGTFTFEFDEAGRILVHSIDDVEEVRSGADAPATAARPLGSLLMARRV